jgi:tetratricopeptide (TPR) repeat protein
LQAGELVYAQGRDRQAAELFERSLTLFRELDDMGGIAEASGKLAAALIPYGDEEGDLERVIRLLTEHAALGRERREPRLLASSLDLLATIAARDDPSRASRLGEESLILYRELGDVRGTLSALGTVAAAVYQVGDLPRAGAWTDEILTLLPRLTLEGDLRVWVRSNLTWAARDRGDYGRAVRFMEMLVARAEDLGDTRNAAHARLGLASLAREQGEYERAQALAQESLAVFQEGEDPTGIAWALIVLSGIARDHGDVEGVVGACEQALALSGGSRASLISWMALHDLGLAARYQGDYERAEALLRETLVILRRRGWLEPNVEVLCDLGLLALEQGQYDRARQAFSESLQTARTWLDGTVLEGLAGVAAGQGQAEQAARLFGAAEMIRRAIGVPRWPANEALYQRLISLTRHDLEEEHFAHAWEEGHAMTTEEVIAYALNQASEGMGG